VSFRASFCVSTTHRAAALALVDELRERLRSDTETIADLQQQKDNDAELINVGREKCVVVRNSTSSGPPIKLRYTWTESRLNVSLFSICSICVERDTLVRLATIRCHRRFGKPRCRRVHDRLYVF
jgi:hypothetical protein